MRLKLLMALAALVLATNVYAHDHAQCQHKSKKGIMQADANKDGKVSFAEFKAAHEARLKERFARKDINNDGFIDLEEKKVAKEKHRKKVQSAKKEKKEALREKYSEDRKKRKRHFYKYK